MLGFLRRSVERATKDASNVLRMSPADLPRRLELYTFKDEASLKDLVVGSDKALGGRSEAVLEHNGDAAHPAAVFRGHVSTEVPADCKYVASGYAGLKTRLLPRTLFGQTNHDLTRYSYLELVARDLSPRTAAAAAEAEKAVPEPAAATATAEEEELLPPPVSGGWNSDEPAPPVPLNQQVVDATAAGSRGEGASPRQFFLNIKATTYAELDLYQYPLKFDSADWHTFQIPFRHFILTHKGFVLDNQRDLPLANVEAFSISVVKQDGPFHIEVASIAATNPPGLSDEELEGELILAHHRGDKERVRQIEHHLKRLDINE
ncbi:hypothetical protein H9P43_001204 [Blastocladiella emersonii ATCC 22665]|nr:hypothetical protein H9P43_001204 [Blastocladiella emersonii ATCC 22665]